MKRAARSWPEFFFFYITSLILFTSWFFSFILMNIYGQKSTVISFEVRKENINCAITISFIYISIDVPTVVSCVTLVNRYFIYIDHQSVLDIILQFSVLIFFYNEKLKLQIFSKYTMLDKFILAFGVQNNCYFQLHIEL